VNLRTHLTAMESKVAALENELVHTKEDKVSHVM